MYFILFLIHIFTNLLFIKFHKKSSVLFLIIPIIYLTFTFLKFILLKLNKIYYIAHQEKKVTKEIPMLIDFFKSYLLAGLLLPYATKSVLKQRQWCSPIHTSLTIICQAYAQGKNFKEGIQLGIQNSKQKKSRQYLSLLFLTLRLGCSTGENLTLLLEKVKTKTQDRLHLERKLRMTTAQMRLQSFVIICSPLFLSLILYIMSPNYILFFFNNIIGNFLLIIMIILNFLGAISIKKILRIK